MSSDLVAFLRARLDEDEAVARAAGSKAWKWEQHYGDMCNDPACEYGELATDDTVLMNVHAYDIRSPWQGAGHIERHHPARVLAEVEAKRGLLGPHELGFRQAKPGVPVCVVPEPCIGGYEHEPWPCTTLRLLVLPYANHADYREEWRP